MSVTDVLEGKASWACVASRAEDFLASLPDDSVDLLVTSPPYEAKRTYGIGFKLQGQDWVDWMVRIVTAAAPKVKGLIAVNCEGGTKNYRYSGTPFLLYADLHRAGFNMRKPCVYQREGIPGSGGPDWLKNRWEPIICVTRPGRLPWSDNTACGKPPVCAPGGAVSYRGAAGKRKTFTRQTRRESDGSRQVATATDLGRAVPDLANPGNIIDCGADTHFGFGNESEAPFPLKLAAFFVKSFCPPQVCIACGTAVQYSHENKTMQTVPVTVPDRQPPTPVLLGSLSEEGLQERGCGAGLRDVREEVPDLGLPSGAKSVLLEGVRGTGDDDGSSAMQAVRRTDPRSEGHPGEQVLLEDVREPVDREEPQGDQVSCQDAEGVRHASRPVPPECDDEGVRHGAPAGDGKAPRKTARSRRGGSPQELNQGRQPVGKPGTHDQAGTRLPAQAKAPHRVPEVRSLHRPFQVCVGCGANLDLIGATSGGVVCDPFSGSGTTCHAAVESGRRFVGCDIRESQVELCKRRLATVTPSLFEGAA